MLKYKPLPGEESVTVLMNNRSNELPILDYVVETKLAPDNSFYPAKYQAYEHGMNMGNLTFFRNAYTNMCKFQASF